MIPPRREVAAMIFEERMVTHEEKDYVYFSIFLVKFQLAEGAVHLEIFSLYSILKLHNSPNKIKVATMSFDQHMVTHEKWNMFCLEFGGKISVNRTCSFFEDIQSV